MNINYLTQYPWGGKTDFDAKILSGEKIHTIRRTNRGVKPGDVLSHGNSGRGYLREEFLVNQCTGTQEIKLMFNNGEIDTAIVDGKEIDWELIAQNDGLTKKHFTDWFKLYKVDNIFKGFIIHWTDLKY